MAYLTAPLTTTKPKVKPAAVGPAAAFAPPAATPSPFPKPEASASPFPVANTPIKTPTPNPATAAFGPAPAAPLQAPGNNLVNPGYGEQALEHTQNRLLEDPSKDMLLDQYGQTQQPNAGENALTQNLGTLNGPGEGDQYWNQVQGQFADPFAGEQFTREATQNFAPTGAAGAFNSDMQGRQGEFTNFSGPGNTQGQYGASSSSLAGGTAGENNMAGIAGGYDSTGRYTGPNNALGQYEQTQSAFGDLPIAEFDPFYDRARQLGVQDYNRQAAGRGVYGSSEALSGVGNVITDIEAQRANRSFDAEMQRAQEQRARQELLGSQARMGDLSATEAFGQNLKGAETFSNINRDMGNLELNRNELLGNMANQADTQALGVQSENRAGVEAFGDIANNADLAETERYRRTNEAMNNADRAALDRLGAGADIAFRGDENARQDYTAEANAANQAGNLANDRTRLGAEIGDTVSDNDLNRLREFNQTAQGAEGQRFSRQVQTMADQFKFSSQVQDALGAAGDSANKYGADEFESWVNAEIAPVLQDASLSQQQKADLMKGLRQMFNDAHGVAEDLED